MKVFQTYATSAEVTLTYVSFGPAVGGVMLNIADAAALKIAARDILEKVGRTQSAAKLIGQV